MPPTTDPGITDPTGGAPNVNIEDVFKSYGYQPTQAEINMFASAFSGRYDIMQTGGAAVADYVTFKQTEAAREASDPLAAYQTRAAQLQEQTFTQAQTLYTQVQDLLSSAPTLFGGLTQDQVQQYMAPLQTAFQQAQATTATAMAGRGVAGSSMEANAMATQEKQFKEQTLATGLQVGLDQQQKKAQSIQQQIQSLLGISGQALGAQGSAASQISAQDLSQSNLISSLPYFERQSAAQTNAMLDAKNKGGGFMQKFYDVTGAINQGVQTFQNLAMIPAQFQSNPKTAPDRTGLSPTGAPISGPGPFAPSVGQEALI